MRLTWTLQVIGRRPAARVFVLASLVVMAPTVLFAQSSSSAPMVIAEGNLGAASYWDNFEVYGTAFGGSARVYVTPRVAVGAEIA